MGFPCGSAGKEFACNVGDMGSIPGLGRPPGEGKGYPLQYSGLRSFIDCRSWTKLSDFHFATTYRLCDLGQVTGPLQASKSTFIPPGTGVRVKRGNKCETLSSARQMDSLCLSSSCAPLLFPPVSLSGYELSPGQAHGPLGARPLHMHGFSVMGNSHQPLHHA